MKLIINGKIKNFNKEVNLIDVLESEDIIDPVAVEVLVNKKKVKFENFNNYKLKDGDEIEYLYLFASG